MNKKLTEAAQATEEIIRERICLERKKRHWSQEVMADELGMSVTSYRKIEVGPTQLTITHITIISIVLSIPMGQLICPEDVQQTNEDKRMQQENHTMLQNILLLLMKPSYAQ